MSDTLAAPPIGPAVSVVIPAYNEAATIVEVVEDCLATLAACCSTYEVIVCDDGSSDRTGHLIDELAERNPRVRAIHNPQNLGTPTTNWNLYRAARYDWICTLPADGQVTATAIPQLLSGLERFDVVVGERTPRRDPWYRLVSAWLWNLAVRLVLGLKVNDVDSVKLYPRTLINAIEVRSRSALMEPEILFEARMRGCRLGNVAVEHHPRRSGKATGMSPIIAWCALRDLLRFRAERLWRSSGGQLTEQPTRWLFLVLVALAGLLLFSDLSARGLEGDEAGYAGIAKHMLKRGDWMTPYFFRSKDNGELQQFAEAATGMVPMWQKTPLGIWLLAGSFMVLGENEFAAQFPTAFLAVAIVALTFSLTLLLTGDRWAAFLAGLVLLTSQPFFGIGVTYVYDTACILLLVAAVYVYVVAHYRDRRAVILVGPLLGAAFFAKVFVPLLAIPVFLADLLFRRDWDMLKSGRLWLGLLLGVVVNVPWFLYEYVRFGDPFVREFLVLTVGLGTKLQAPGYPDDFFYRNHALYYVQYWLLFYLPWLFLLPAAFLDAWRGKHRHVARFALLWTAAFFLAFSAASTRLQHYVGPVYPILSVVIGIFLAQLTAEGARLSRVAVTALLAMAVARVGYLAYALSLPVDLRPTIPLGLRWWISLTCALLITTLLARRATKRVVAGVGAVLYALTLSVTTSYHIYVGRVDQRTVREYVAHAGPNARLVGVAEEDLSRSSNGLYWHFGQIPFATDSRGLDRLLAPSTDRLFIIADDWGARIVSSKLPGAVVKLRFQDARRLILFELNGRAKG